MGQDWSETVRALLRYPPVRGISVVLVPSSGGPCLWGKATWEALMFVDRADLRDHKESALPKPKIHKPEEPVTDEDAEADQWAREWADLVREKMRMRHARRPITLDEMTVSTTAASKMKLIPRFGVGGLDLRSKATGRGRLR